VIELSAKASQKRSLSLKIESYEPEVLNSASIDLEWIPYKGKYSHEKTRIFAACFCTNWGQRIILHISDYLSEENPEKELILDILSYLEQFPMTFGWYTTGIAIFDSYGNRKKGRDSDFFILHQRCILYNLESPFEEKENYVKIKNDLKRNHIDLIKVFEKPIVKDNVFEGRYRTTSLDAVGSTLLGIRKYHNLDPGLESMSKVPIEEQKKYVRRDAELVMLLAQYNSCLVLRLMKVFAGYAEMDYYKVCHTNVSTWYANKYKKMIQRGECILSFTPDYKLQKQEIGGGHHVIPARAFFVNKKVYELDVKGMYPTIVRNNNLSFDTLNCTCCEYDPSASLSQGMIDTINRHLEENKIPRKIVKYWVCKRRIGAFPRLLDQVLKDRDKYLQLLRAEKSKPNQNRLLIEEYETWQKGAKLFANAGFGLFANEYFEFSNYKVAECITGEGRRLHRQMEEIAKENGLDIVFGFTDSVFVKSNEAVKGKQDGLKLIQAFINESNQRLAIAVELKNIFVNSIFYGKKNRFVAWNGLQDDQEPVIKGLEGLANSNPLWVRKWFRKIIFEIIKNPEMRFETVSNIVGEAFFELKEVICKNKNKIEHELKFSQRLKKSAYEYENVRTGVLSRLLNKDKGEEIFWYEVIHKDKYTKRIYSITTPVSEEVNTRQYMNYLLNKLSDTLEIAGFDIIGLRLTSIQKTFPITSESLI
jgi:DNA polymerase, archaea type